MLDERRGEGGEAGLGLGEHRVLQVTGTAPGGDVKVESEIESSGKVGSKSGDQRKDKKKKRKNLKIQIKLLNCPPIRPNPYLSNKKI